MQVSHVNVQAVQRRICKQDHDDDRIPVTDGTILALSSGQDTAFYFVETKDDRPSVQKPKLLALLNRAQVRNLVSALQLASTDLIVPALPITTYSASLCSSSRPTSPLLIYNFLVHI